MPSTNIYIYIYIYIAKSLLFTVYCLLSISKLRVYCFILYIYCIFFIPLFVPLIVYSSVSLFTSLFYIQVFICKLLENVISSRESSQRDNKSKSKSKKLLTSFFQRPIARSMGDLGTFIAFSKITTNIYIYLVSR